MTDGICDWLRCGRISIMGYAPREPVPLKEICRRHWIVLSKEDQTLGERRFCLDKLGFSRSQQKTKGSLRMAKTRAIVKVRVKPKKVKKSVKTPKVGKTKKAAKAKKSGSAKKARTKNPSTKAGKAGKRKRVKAGSKSGSKSKPKPAAKQPKKSSRSGKARTVNKDGRNVIEAWAHAFRENEKAKQSKRLTDEQLSKKIQGQFPENKSAQIRKLSEVQVKRNLFNRGRMPLQDCTKPKQPSRRYATDGSVMEITRGRPRQWDSTQKPGSRFVKDGIKLDGKTKTASKGKPSVKKGKKRVKAKTSDKKK